MSIRRSISGNESPALAKSERIARAIEAEIRAGRFGHGQRLESETALGARYAASRSTVRKSLQQLSDRGLIVTRMGLGSFVAFDGKTLDNAIGWSRALAESGATTRTEVLSIRIALDAALAARIGCEEDSFLFIDRRRLLATSDEVITLEFSRLPMVPALEAIPRHGLCRGSIHATLRAAGLVVDHGEEWVGLHRLSAAEAETLGHPAGAPFLETRRLARSVDGRVIEYVVSFLDPAHFALHLEF